MGRMTMTTPITRHFVTHRLELDMVYQYTD